MPGVQGTVLKNNRSPKVKGRGEEEKKRREKKNQRKTDSKKDRQMIESRIIKRWGGDI